MWGREPPWLLLVALTAISSYNTAWADDEAWLAMVDTPLRTEIAQIGESGTIKKYQEQLVGLFVDGRKYDSIQVIHHRETWYLPLDQVSEIFGVQYRPSDMGLVLSTPQGEYIVGEDTLLRFNGRWFISSSALEEQLKFQVEFDNSTYALKIFLPWSATASIAGSVPSIEPDVVPSAVSLGQIRSDIFYTHAESLDNEIRTVNQLRGGMWGGAWHVQYSTRSNGQDRPDEYYWVRATANSQWLVGRDVFSPNPLIPGTEMTGVQWAWSNQAITSNYQRRGDINSFNEAVGNAPRQIRGNSEPGAIAELRVDGNRQAVTRVRMDGTFEFLEVELSEQQYNEVEVVIYNRQRTTIIERIDFSMLGSNRLLNHRQSLVYAGGGKYGNWLADDVRARENDFVGALMLRHGVGENLTLEASYANTALSDYKTVGFSSLVGRRVALDGSVSSNDDSWAWSIEAGSRGENWRAFVSIREFDAGFRRPEGPREFYQNLDFQYRVLPRLQLYLRGRHSNNGRGTKEQFLLPGVGWFERNWSVSAIPSYNGSYRFAARWFRDNFNATFQHDNDQNYLSAYYRFRPELVFFGNLREGGDIPNRAEVGVDWYINSLSDNNSRLQASLLASNVNGTGYSLLWQTPVIPGVFGEINLLRDPAISLLSGKEETRAMIQLTVDLAFNGRRFVPAESYSFRVSTGSLSGRLVLAENDRKELDDVGIISVKVNNIRRRVPLRGNYFFVDNLPVGIHMVELDSSSLPIELTPEKDIRWVKITPGSVTTMDFQIELRIGFAGRVSDNRGAPLPNTSISIQSSQSGESWSTRTDIFGLYRIDGLLPGEYVVSIVDTDGETTGTRVVRLVGDYLFDQDVSTE